MPERRVISYLASENAEIPSSDTSADCQARNRLPEKLLSRLFGQVGQGLEEQVTNEHLWCGESSAQGAGFRCQFSTPGDPAA